MLEQLYFINQNTALILVLLTSLLFAVIGIFYSKRYRGYENYFTAGRKIGIFLAWVIGCIGALIVSFLYQNYYVAGLGFFLMGFGVNPAITLQFSFFNEHSSNNFKKNNFLSWKF